MSDELVSPILLSKGGQLTVIDLWFSLLLLSFCFSFVGFLFLGCLCCCFKAGITYELPLEIHLSS